MKKIARLKEQSKLVTSFARMIKKSQLAIVLILKAKTINYCTIVLDQVLDKKWTVVQSWSKCFITIFRRKLRNL